MVRLAAVVVVLVAGCDAHLGTPAGTAIDAPPGSSSDGPGGSSPDAPGSSAACANGRVVFLDFEGETLTQATGASDATQNMAVWMGVGSATLPKFRDGVAGRAGQISQVTDLVKQKLAGIPEITVVTARPANGPYFMVGFGGAHQTVNVPYLYAVNRLDCGDAATKNDLAWVFEDAPSTQKAADFAVGSILFGLGATGTNDVNDCLCGWLTACQPANAACTISSSVTAALSCPNQTNPQDEVAILHTFCQ